MGEEATAVWRVQRGQTLPPQPKQCLRTRTRCFKFYANDSTEKDVSRPIIHCSLPKHLINGLIQALYVAHNNAQKHAGKECGGDEGLWIPTEPDHIKHLNHYPSSLSSSHHDSAAHCAIFLTRRSIRDRQLRTRISSSGLSLCTQHEWQKK